MGSRVYVTDSIEQKVYGAESMGSRVSVTKSIEHKLSGAGINLNLIYNKIK